MAVDRLPGHLLVTISGTDSDALLFGLDAAGIAASSGSACTAGVTQPSHVLLAMGEDDRTARSALRFTAGRTSTDADVDAVLAVLPGVVARARAAFLPRQGASLSRGHGLPRPLDTLAPSGRAEAGAR